MVLIPALFNTWFYCPGAGYVTPLQATLERELSIHVCLGNVLLNGIL